MLKLSKKVDYGLIALMHLARNGEGSSWSDKVTPIPSDCQQCLLKSQRENRLF